jgi:2-methylisocitrate lyase-like PEP mutase family enzyme
MMVGGLAASTAASSHALARNPAGARRISVGGALARAATSAFVRAARELAGAGSRAWSGGLLGLSEVETLLD